jgi:hypothetical protein
MVSFGETLYSATTGFHDLLKKPGYLPFVGTVIGAVRIVAAVAGAALSALGMLASVLTLDLDAFRYFTVTFVLSVIYAARGAIELIPFVGGAVCFGLDVCVGCINIGLDVLLLPVKLVAE